MVAHNPLGPLKCLDCFFKAEGKSDYSDVQTWWKYWWIEDESRS